MVFLRRLRFSVVAAVALSFADTAVAIDPSGAAAAYPYARVPRVHYRPVLDEYRASPNPTPPADWRELNDLAETIGGPRGQLRSIGEPIRKREKR